MRSPLTLAVAVALSGTAAARQPIVTTDLLRIRTVTAIDVADDGSKAVFAVRSIATVGRDEESPDAETAYANRSHLFLLNLYDVDARPRQLTFGDRSDGGPRLSPDGRWIAFVRGDENGEENNDTSQVWVMPVDGGEARQITELEHGASWGGAGAWSPDGRRLLVASSLPADEIDGRPPYPPERPSAGWDHGADGTTGKPDGSRAEIRAWLAANEAEGNPVLISRLDFQQEQGLRGPMRFTHLYLVDTHEPPEPPRRITGGFFDHGQASFMPDGRSIVYAAKKRSPQRHPDRILATELWRIDADGTDDRMILSLDGWALENPVPNRDGSLIAFHAYRLDEPAFRQLRIGLGNPDGRDSNEVAWLTNPETFDSPAWDFEWMPDGTQVVFVTATRGVFPLMKMGPGLVQPAPLVDELTPRPHGVPAFDVGGGAIVFAMTSPSNPCVLMVRDGRGLRMAFDLNAWVKTRTLSMPTEGWVSRPDGTNVQYWVMEPTNLRPARKYPLALEIHGGPSVMWGPGEFTMWLEFQLLCSWGYGVVYANPRGSGGYGYGFRRGNFQNWGEGPAGDVLAALDQAALNQWVDDRRLVVTGGSYAGYLTAWIVAHDTRFKAAVAQRGVYDLATFFGEGNAWRLVEWAMGGPPHDARYRDIIDRNSPLTYVNRIRTPLLIMHASRDLRAGVSQSEMLYRALKALDRPVEYVRYPDAGHDLSRTGDPRQRLDRLDRIIDFFERHIDNPRPAPVVTTEENG